MPDYPFADNMTLMLENPYGIDKLAAKKMLKGVARVYSTEYVILVPHNIISPRQCYEDSYRNVAAIIIIVVFQGKQPVIFEDSIQKWCFSFINESCTLF